MKPPSSITGGGYRRKAEQDTLGRNSRIRYTTYVPFDKRMMPASNARIYANSNRVVGTRAQGTGNNLNAVGASFVSWTPTNIDTTTISSWRYTVNWQIHNPTSTQINYTVKAKTSNNTLLTFRDGVNQTFTAVQNLTSTETAKFIDITATDILQAGENTFQIQFINNADNSIMFTYNTPAVNLFDFSNITQTANSTVTVTASGTLNAYFEFTHTVIPNSLEQVLGMIIYYREINQPSYTLVGAPSYINGQNTATSGVYVTIPNNGQVTTTNFSREWTPNQNNAIIEDGRYEVYAVIRFLPSQQPNLPSSGPTYNFFSYQLPNVNGYVYASTMLATDTDPGTLQTTLFFSALTSQQIEALLTEVNIVSVEAISQITSGGVTQQFTNVMTNNNDILGFIIDWNSVQGVTITAGQTYQPSRVLRANTSSGTTIDLISQTDAAFTKTVRAANAGFGEYFRLSDYFSGGSTIFRDTVYSGNNGDISLVNNKLEFVYVDPNDANLTEYYSVARIHPPSPNQDQWLEWVPSLQDSFDMSMTFQGGFNTPNNGTNQSEYLSWYTTKDHTSTLDYHIGISIEHTGTAGQKRFIPIVMWIDKLANEGGNLYAGYNMFNSAQKVYSNNTILNDGDTIAGASATEYTITYKYRYIVDQNVSLATLRMFVNGYFQAEYLADINATFDNGIHLFPNLDTNPQNKGFSVYNQLADTAVHDIVITRTAEHESQDRITSIPTFSATYVSATSFAVTVSNLVVSIATTLYKVYVRYGNVIYGPHDSTGHTAAQIISNPVSVTVTNSSLSLPGSITYEVLLRPSSWATGVENYVGEFKKDDNIASPYPLKLWSLGDYVTLPFNSSNNQTYSATTSILPSESYDFRITMEMTALDASGIANNSWLLVGHSDLYNQGTYWGMRVGRQGNDVYMFYYPSGNTNMFAPGGAPFYHNPMGLGDTCKIVYTYTASTLVSAIELFINGNQITLNNPTHQHTSGWLQYNPSASSYFYALGHGIAYTQWDKVLVERLGP